MASTKELARYAKKMNDRRQIILADEGAFSKLAGHLLENGYRHICVFEKAPVSCDYAYRLEYRGSLSDDPFAFLKKKKKRTHDIKRRYTAKVDISEYADFGTAKRLRAEFDFTVLSSISEGQPLSVLESFAAGRPCVTTDVGCCKELIFGDGDDELGQAGYCVPPMQPHELARAMEDLCRNSARRLQMGRIAKKRAEMYFRHEDMIRNYLEVYREVFRRWEAGKD